MTYLRGIIARPRTFTSGEAALISGVSQVQQRDWRRRGFPVAAGPDFSLLDVARLLLVKTITRAGIGATIGWDFSAELAGAIVVAAARVPGSVVDNADATRNYRGLENVVGLELLGAKAVAGPILAWAPGIAPQVYASAPDAITEIHGRLAEPLPITVLDMTWLGKLMAERAGTLGSLERSADD